VSADAARDPISRALHLAGTIAAVGEPQPVGELVRLLEALGEGEPRILATLAGDVERAQMSLGRVRVALELYGEAAGARR
jgi:hypothetical protein